jgi:hypothetical protein
VKALLVDPGTCGEACRESLHSPWGEIHTRIVHHLCKTEFKLGVPRWVTIPKGKARVQEREREGDNTRLYSVVSSEISGVDGKPGIKEARRRVGAYNAGTIVDWQ